MIQKRQFHPYIRPEIISLYDPKIVVSTNGTLVEVAIPASEYHAYLRFLSKNFDWESLPAHLQDAIDLMLIDEIRSEKSGAVEFSSLLTVQ